MGNLRAIGLASREDSCVHPIPYTSMSVLVGFMVGVWVVFCVVVHPVLGSCIPVVSKLVLSCPATEPPEVHIHHFAPARDNSIVNNPSSSGVVCLDRAFGLGLSHVPAKLSTHLH